MFNPGCCFCCEIVFFTNNLNKYLSVQELLDECTVSII